MLAFIRFALLLDAVAAFKLRLLQWNPHWQCFGQGMDCASPAKESMSAILSLLDLDFANIVDFVTDGYTPPLGWSMMNCTCPPKAQQVTTLIYNSDRWRLGVEPKGGQCGCMIPHGRPCIVQQFEHINNGSKLIVAGAHFPHNNNYDVLRHAIQSTSNATGVSRVVLIADTNVVRYTSSRTIMQRLGIRSPIISTDLRRTCCVGNDFYHIGTFDRIISNFGLEMTTTVFFERLPAWAAASPQLHKPIMGILSGKDWGHQQDDILNDGIGWVGIHAAAIVVACVIGATACLCLARRSFKLGYINSKKLFDEDGRSVCPDSKEPLMPQNS